MEVTIVEVATEVIMGLNQIARMQKAKIQFQRFFFYAIVHITSTTSFTQVTDEVAVVVIAR